MYLLHLLFELSNSMKNSKKIVKFILFLIFAVFLKMTIHAQEFKNLDKIPHDISYFRTSKVATPLVKIIYGRPHRNGQKIFGNIVKYGEIWQTGANEATEIKFYQDIIFGNKKVPAGTYVLYSIPGETEWEIVLSANLDVWESYQYDPIFDIVKISVPTAKAEELDVFSIAFKEKHKKLEMILAWDTTRVKIPIYFTTKEEYVKL